MMLLNKAGDQVADSATEIEGDDTLVLDLHGYSTWQAVELAEESIQKARHRGYRFIEIIHGAPDIYHWKLVQIMERGSIKWALRGALSRGQWKEHVYGRRSRRHDIRDGSMTLALRPSDGATGADLAVITPLDPEPPTHDPTMWVDQ